MNPSDTNLLAYMRYQRHVMNKSEVFAERWQRLVWTVPELDYGLTGRPTNSMAIGAFDERQRERQAQAIRALAATHGLLFIFRSDCPYCHRLAPILKRFEQDGMLVFPVSLDGRGLPDTEPATRQRYRNTAQCLDRAGAVLTAPPSGRFGRSASGDGAH